MYEVHWGETLKVHKFCVFLVMWCLSSQVTWKAIWILFKITCVIIQVVLCGGKESDLSPWQLQSPPPLPSGYNRAILGSTSATWTWEHADGSWERCVVRYSMVEEKTRGWIRPRASSDCHGKLVTFYWHGTKKRYNFPRARVWLEREWVQNPVCPGCNPTFNTGSDRSSNPPITQLPHL